MSPPEIQSTPSLHRRQPFQEAANEEMGRRLSIHLSGRMAALVRRLADTSGLRVSDTVKASVATFEFLDDQVRAGGQILIEDADGRLLKVPWPPRSPS